MNKIIVWVDYGFMWPRTPRQLRPPFERPVRIINRYIVC
jgi:hypothetical protein